VFSRLGIGWGGELAESHLTYIRNFINLLL